MPYKIKLTDAEIETLARAVSHGYFPSESYDDWTMTEKSQIEAERMEDYGTRGQNHSTHEFEYEISENAAWAITMQRSEDSDSLFACIADPLLGKLILLENSIV